MIQDTLFDPYPLGELWERPQSAMIEIAPLVQTNPPTVNCLKCGKVSVGMFCNAKCRTAWIGSMNAWQARMSKTRIEGEQTLGF